MSISRVKPTFKFMDIFKLKVDHDLNAARFIPGQNVCGIIVAGNLDLPTMRKEIQDEWETSQSEWDKAKAAGVKDDQLPQIRAIREPLHVNQMDNGDLIIFRGTRRASASQTFPDMAGTPQGLIEALKNTPVMLYKGLTREEMLEGVNDQTVKKFSKAGIVNWIWKMDDAGHSARTIALQVAPQLEEGNFSAGMTTAIKKAKLIAPGRDHDDAIKNAVKAFLEQECLIVNRLTDRVKAAFLTKYLIGDGLIPADTKAEFNCNRGAISDLNNAMKADKDGGGWNVVDGGAVYNAVLAKLCDGKPKDPSTPRPKASVVDELFAKLQSKLGQHVAKFVKDGLPNGILSGDQKVFNRELAIDRIDAAKGKFVKDATMPMSNVLELLNAVSDGDYKAVERIVAVLAIG